MQNKAKREREEKDTLERQSKKFASWKCIYCVMYSNGGQPGTRGAHPHVHRCYVSARVSRWHARTRRRSFFDGGGSGAGRRRVGALQQEGRLLPEKN